MGNGKEIIKFIENLRIENNELKVDVSKKLGIDYFTFCWFHNKSDSNVSIDIINKIINNYKMTDQQKLCLINIMNKSAQTTAKSILFELYIKHNLNQQLLSKKLGFYPYQLHEYCSYQTSNNSRIEITNKLIEFFPDSISDILKMDEIIKFKIDEKITKKYNVRLSKTVSVANINIFEIRNSLNLTQEGLAKILNVTYQRIDQLEKGNRLMSPSLYCLCVRKKILDKNFALENVDNYFSKRKKDARLIIKIAIYKDIDVKNVLDAVFPANTKYKQLGFFELTKNKRKIIQKVFDLTDEKFYSFYK